MPRFFIDVRDGETLFEDGVGSEHPNYESGRAELLRALPEIAQFKLIDGKNHRFVFTMRDDIGRALYRGILEFQGEELRVHPSVTPAVR